MPVFKMQVTMQRFTVEDGVYTIRIEAPNSEKYAVSSLLILDIVQLSMVAQFEDDQHRQQISELGMAELGPFTRQGLRLGGANKLIFIAQKKTLNVPALNELCDQVAGPDKAHQKTFVLGLYTQDELLKARKKAQRKAETKETDEETAVQEAVEAIEA